MSVKNRKDLTLKDQFELIKKSEKKPKPSQGELAKEFFISQSAVCKILKRKDEIIQRFETTADQLQKRRRPEPFGEINTRLFEFFSSARSKGTPISGPLLKEKALSIANEIGLVNFKASEGWLEKFKQRYGLEFLSFLAVWWFKYHLPFNFKIWNHV